MHFEQFYSKWKKFIRNLIKPKEEMTFYRIDSKRTPRPTACKLRKELAEAISVSACTYPWSNSSHRDTNMQLCVNAEI